MRGKHGYNGAYFTEPRRERRIGERIRAVLSASRSVSRTAYALGGKANGGGENGGKSRNGTGGEEPSRTEGQYIPHEDAFEEADRRALGKLSDDGARRGILSYIRVFSDVRDRDRVQGILSDDGASIRCSTFTTPRSTVSAIFWTHTRTASVSGRGSWSAAPRWGFSRRSSTSFFC